jgi:type VI secretion system protein ImpB
MADDSTQHWIGRNRPPRVQITYDLETGGADTKKELPLVVGILADLAGPAAGEDAEALAKLKTRKFIEIDRDNFNDVMKSIAPKLTVSGNDLSFSKLDDFRPEQIVQQVGTLKNLLAVRVKLNDLLTKLDGNDTLNSELWQVVENTEQQTQLRSALPAMPQEQTDAIAVARAATAKPAATTTASTSSSTTEPPATVAEAAEGGDDAAKKGKKGKGD